MEEQKYTSLELEAMKWLKETDEMQFDQWELLAMFARHSFTMQRDRIIAPLKWVDNIQGACDGEICQIAETIFGEITITNDPDLYLAAKGDFEIQCRFSDDGTVECYHRYFTLEEAKKQAWTIYMERLEPERVLNSITLE